MSETRRPLGGGARLRRGGRAGAFHARLAATLDALGDPAEVVYVNDGSRDRTLALLERLRASDPRVGVLDLSRNFGKEVALTAGLDQARGEAVVVIDADLQDPPELIPELRRAVARARRRRGLRAADAPRRRELAQARHRPPVLSR